MRRTVGDRIWNGDDAEVSRALNDATKAGFKAEETGRDADSVRIKISGTEVEVKLTKPTASTSTPKVVESSGTRIPRGVPNFTKLPPLVQGHLRDADAALAKKDVHAAIKAFDKLGSAMPAAERAKIESAMANAHGVTDPAVYRDPHATLPNGAKIKPSAYGGARYYGTHELTPKVVFEEGLLARGSNTAILEHVHQDPDSAFRGTTSMVLSPRRDKGAAAWAGEGGWVYKIDGVASWDVNVELQGRVPRPDGSFGDNPVPGELEHAILAGVPRERIEGAIPVTEKNGKLALGQMLPNPHYKPLK